MVEAAAVLTAVAVGTTAATWAVAAILGRLSRRGRGVLAHSLVTNLRLPAIFIVPLLALEVATAWLALGKVGSDLLHGFGVALDLSVGFLIVRSTYVLDDLLVARYRMDVADNLRARQVQTQIQVFRRVTLVAVSVVTLAVALLTFSAVRVAGAGLLASAGVVGLVAGAAAKPVATNVIAGLQIAFSQPIRVDDVVVVDGEWGRIEEIALTYAVVRIWNLRRLVIPISYFIEQPFENWTRDSSEVLGWVHLHVDYAAPVDELRRYFGEVLAASPNWNGEVGTLQVTDAGPTTMQVRALMSANDSGASWDLQCEVRERLISWLHREHPGVLPRQRTQLVTSSGDGLDVDEPREADTSGRSASASGRSGSAPR